MPRTSGGYGWTTGADTAFDADLRFFGMPNLVTDMLCLLRALGRPSVEAVIGHDFGSPVAAWSALCRPDIFRSAVLMSAPFGGSALPEPAGAAAQPDIHAAMAALPRPRKHYQWYYSTPEANRDMTESPQGMRAFLRAYYHHKSADWVENKPYRLSGWTADALAELPTYYIMDLDQTMPETVAPHMPTEGAIRDCAWLPDTELGVYVSAYERNGFQAPLQWYRARTTGHSNPAMQLFAGRSIDVPSCSSRGRAIGASTRYPATLRRCRRRRAAACSAVTWSRGPGIGSSRSSPQRCWAICSLFLTTRGGRGLETREGSGLGPWEGHRLDLVAVGVQDEGTEVGRHGRLPLARHIGVLPTQT